MSLWTSASAPEKVANTVPSGNVSSGEDKALSYTPLTKTTSKQSRPEISAPATIVSSSARTSGDALHTSPFSSTRRLVYFHSSDLRWGKETFSHASAWRFWTGANHSSVFSGAYAAAWETKSDIKPPLQRLLTSRSLFLQVLGLRIYHLT